MNNTYRQLRLPYSNLCFFFRFYFTTDTDKGIIDLLQHDLFTRL